MRTTTSLIAAAVLAASLAVPTDSQTIQRFPVSPDAAVKIRALDAQEARLRVQIQAISNERDITIDAELGVLGLSADNWRYNRRYAAFEPRPKKGGKL